MNQKIPTNNFPHKFKQSLDLLVNSIRISLSSSGDIKRHEPASAVSCLLLFYDDNSTALLLYNLPTATIKTKN